jgi:hypothetical protein
VSNPTCRLAAILASLTALAAATPAVALPNGEQLMSGGGQFDTVNATVYSAPGVATVFDSGTAMEERAAQIFIWPGTLKRLRVKVRVDAPPTAGALIATVRMNGAPTAMTCTIPFNVFMGSFGLCGFNPNVAIGGGWLAVQIADNFVGVSDMAVTYSFVYD